MGPAAGTPQIGNLPGQNAILGNVWRTFRGIDLGEDLIYTDSRAVSSLSHGRYGGSNVP